MIFGKNTMIRKCILNLTEDGDHPEWATIIPVMKGNLGFIFTNGDFDAILETLKEYVKPAAAKAGVIAPCSCTIPKGPTGLDPAQTSFFQALNIATKINKGSIEIINDCKVLTEGVKVGSSEAALLTKMGIKPFQYGLEIRYVYEGGIFDPSVLKITDADLTRKFAEAVGHVASISLATGITTEASLPHLIINAAKDITAVAVECGYIEFDAAKRVQEFVEHRHHPCCESPRQGSCAAFLGIKAASAAARSATCSTKPDRARLSSLYLMSRIDVRRCVIGSKER